MPYVEFNILNQEIMRKAIIQDSFKYSCHVFTKSFDTGAHFPSIIDVILKK